MKKLVFAISVLCYLVVTCGVVVNFHYCMKRLDAVTFFQTATDTCGRCGMETHESNGCCHDEVKVIKLEQDQVLTKIFLSKFQSPDPIVVYASAFLVASIYNEERTRHFHNHSPPLLSAQDTYIKNNVFRI